MAFSAFYRAWDVSNNVGKTGDAANHTVSVEVDGTDVTGLTETEVGNGLYRVSLSDAQLPEGSRFAVHGSSATADIEIIGETGVRPVTMRGTDNALLASSAPTNWSSLSINGSGHISRVVLVDTTTTNTDMRGTDNASTHTAANVRTEIDNNSTQLAAIVADTNELQGDWTDGGRLDLILDAILVDTGTTLDGKLDTIDGNVDSILTDTGTTIPGLINGLNDLSAAEVNAEVDTALSDYDPPTKAEMDSAFTEIKGATWSSTTDTLEAIRDRGDSAWITATGFSTHGDPDPNGYIANLNVGGLVAAAADQLKKGTQYRWTNSDNDSKDVTFDDVP